MAITTRIFKNDQHYFLIHFKSSSLRYNINILFTPLAGRRASRKHDILWLPVSSLLLECCLSACRRRDIVDGHSWYCATCASEATMYAKLLLIIASYYIMGEIYHAYYQSINRSINLKKRCSALINQRGLEIKPRWRLSHKHGRVPIDEICWPFRRSKYRRISFCRIITSRCSQSNIFYRLIFLILTLS